MQQGLLFAPKYIGSQNNGGRWVEDGGWQLAHDSTGEPMTPILGGFKIFSVFFLFFLAYLILFFDDVMCYSNY
jgi:hypothetical protein